MDYLCALISMVCIGGQFAVAKLYQTKVGNRATTTLLFSLFSGLVSVVLFAFACGFKISFNWFAFFMAIGRAVCIVLYTVLGLKMMSIGKVAVYTLFIMIGGMVLPFLYGAIFLSEQISVWKIVGLVLLITSLLLPVLKKDEKQSKSPKLLFLLGIIIFVLNGLVGIFSKTHQISENALPTLEFGFWVSVVNAVSVAIAVSVYAVANKGKSSFIEETKKVLPKWWIIVMFAIVSQAGGIFQLVAATTIEASVLYPLVAGGTMVASTVLSGLMFKEKPNKLLTVCLLLSVISTVMFIF